MHITSTDPRKPAVVSYLKRTVPGCRKVTQVTLKGSTYRAHCLGAAGSLGYHEVTEADLVAPAKA